MKNVFAKLVARAWDTAPRARPDLGPRFAPRAAESWAVEEVDAEIEAAPPGRAPASAPAGVEERVRQVPRGEPPAPPSLRRDDFEPVRGMPVSPPVVRTVERAKGEEMGRPAPVRGLEREDVSDPRSVAAPPRAVESPIARALERVREVVAASPVAASPPRLRSEDVAALRSASVPRAEAARVASEPPRSVRPLAPPVAAPEREAPAPIEISIGRIDVRAIPAAPPVAPRSLVGAPVALPLHEYLRRRQEGS
jgi:hypothetical protein